MLSIYRHEPMVRSHFVDPRVNADDRIVILGIFGLIHDLIRETLGQKMPIWQDITMTREEIHHLLDTIRSILDSAHITTIEDYLDYILNIILNEDNICSKELKRSYMSNEIVQFVRSKILNDRYYTYFK